MVVITEELIRKRAEHNEGLIFSLEEISLHQSDIEKIENIDKLCRDLKILYLQSNLIDRIENVSKLKQLEYLNLALNNVQRVENLEKCENLKKLDLTVNFVAELTSLETLRGNEFLEDLYLTGNPCSKFEDYRSFVVGTLPQLKRLDGIEITNTERLEAIQNIRSLRESVVREQNDHFLKEQRKREGRGGRWYTDIGAETAQIRDDKQPGATDKDNHNGMVKDEEGDTGNENNKDFWNEPTEYTPETRKEIHRKLEADRAAAEEQRQNVRSNKIPKRQTVLERNGKRLNLNQAKWPFRLDDCSDANLVSLEVGIPKYLGTHQIDVDVQADYVKIVAENRTFQLVLQSEVSPDASTCQRSQITGELSLKMPKLHQIPVLSSKPKVKSFKEENSQFISAEKAKTSTFLEFDSKPKVDVDYSKIVENNQKILKPMSKPAKVVIEKPVSADFIDNDDVPPLI